MKDVKAPTLLVTGDEDKICDPKTAEEAARELPNGHFLAIPKCGHAPQIEKALADQPPGRPLPERPDARPPTRGWIATAQPGRKRQPRVPQMSLTHPGRPRRPRTPAPSRPRLVADAAASSSSTGRTIASFAPSSRFLARKTCQRASTSTRPGASSNSGPGPGRSPPSWSRRVQAAHQAPRGRTRPGLLRPAAGQVPGTWTSSRGTPASSTSCSPTAASAQVDHVLSGLPLPSFPAPLRDAILASVGRMPRPGRDVPPADGHAVGVPQAVPRVLRGRAVPARPAEPAAGRGVRLPRVPVGTAAAVRLRPTRRRGPRTTFPRATACFRTRRSGSTMPPDRVPGPAGSPAPRSSAGPPTPPSSSYAHRRVAARSTAWTPATVQDDDPAEAGPHRPRHPVRPRPRLRRDPLRRRLPGPRPGPRLRVLLDDVLEGRLPPPRRRHLAGQGPVLRPLVRHHQRDDQVHPGLAGDGASNHKAAFTTIALFRHAHPAAEAVHRQVLLPRRQHRPAQAGRRQPAPAT